MTDPVDTDALRTFGQAMQVDMPDHLYLADQVISAADEVDRLRADLDACKRFRADRTEAKLTAMLTGERAVTDRLRAVIEDAPHAVDCRANFHGGDRYGYGGDARYCICWKSDAL